MSEPLRSEPARPGDAAEGDKEARIEQLLLTGLDHYFAGQYDQAINVWTRVVFLERGHDRARAYIERARGALAERHRESEELLHRGVAAFESGETDEARDLITRAVEQGGPQDVALVFLERLNRLRRGGPVADAPRVAAPERRARARLASDTSDVHHWAARTIAATALVGAAFAGLLLGGAPILEWLSAWPAGEPAEQVLPSRPEPVPIAQSSEVVIARARSLQAGGHLRDALRMLDTIEYADPLRDTADRLRGQVQRQLLESSRVDPAGSSATR
jgi:tetratricopeptide (TPR) repeat protein